MTIVFRRRSFFDEVIDVANAMKKYGGSFVQALGAALLQADANNIKKIKQTWPGEWSKYYAMRNKAKG